MMSAALKLPACRSIGPGASAGFAIGESSPEQERPSHGARLQRIKWWIKRHSTVHRQREQSNIFIFSTARSGSTWLMEVIASQPGIKYISEPLYLTQFRHGGPLPASWDFLLPHPGREPALEHYFQQLLENRLAIGTPSPFSRFHRVISHRIVVKDLRCHDLMNWFEQRFGFQIIYLVRHPIPASLSRKSYARLPLFLGNYDYCARFLTPRLRSYANSILERGSDLEKKVLDWCLQNLPPLKFLDRSNWLCLHYEDLVLDPTVPIDRLAGRLGLADKRRMLEQARRASRSVFLSDAETRRLLSKAPSGQDRLYLINRWRSRISPDQEKRVRELLLRFDIGLYDPAAELPITRL